MAIIILQQDWRLLACHHEQEATDQQYMTRIDDFCMQTLENAYTMKQKKNCKTSFKPAT